jgi:fructose-1,6-bisphosphatase I
MDTHYVIPEDYPKGGFLLLFDPLDGSSNIDVNVSIGTIFSVLKLPDGRARLDEACFLQPGRQQVAAGYAVYGPSTLLVLTVGDGVACFTLDKETGSWSLTGDQRSARADTKEFAIKRVQPAALGPPVRRWVDEMLAGKDGPAAGLQHALGRLDGGRRAPHHEPRRRLHLPADAREPDKPGKLRLMYEANRWALLVEQAGGAATDGRRRILDIQPESCAPAPWRCFLGSRNEVEPRDLLPRADDLIPSTAPRR